MSALAQTLRAKGFAVSGSDRYLDQGKKLEVLTTLEKAGVRLFPQDGSGVQSDTCALIISTAVEADNPDMIKAGQEKIPVIHRAKMLAQLIGSETCLAIAGTSGKTTVTGMVGWILEQTGCDPFVVNGGCISAWEDVDRTGNIRPSSQPLWVIEADESDRSFLHFTPSLAVITNISRDHFALDETILLFEQFTSRVSRKIICTQTTARQLDAVSPEKLMVINNESISRDAQGWFFSFEGRSCRVSLPGRHNAENALLAASISIAFGCDPEAVCKALASFPGIRRRLEMKGYCNGMTVLDDFAHNPEKMRAAWQTVKEQHATITGIWRPHGFGPLAAMFDLFVDMLKEVVTGDDLFYVLPIYYVGGTTSRTMTSADFVNALQKAGINAAFAPGYEILREILPKTSGDDRAILCMGARDPELPKFAESLVD